jgi:diguanylate cyclase (GGDEF)-like protein
MQEIRLIHRIGSKVLFAFLVAIIPLIGVIVSLNWYINRDAMEHVRGLVCRAVFEAAAEQDGLVAQLREMLLQVAARLETRSRDAAALEALLRRAREEKPFLAHLLWCDTAGTVLASAGPGQGGGAVGPRPSVRGALDRGGFSLGRFAVDRTTGQPVMEFAFPTKDAAGQITGVLVAALDLDGYARALARLEVPQGGVLELFDEAGTRLLRYPAGDDRPADRILEAGSREKVFGRQGSGFFVTAGTGTGERLLAFRQLLLEKDDPRPYGAVVVVVPVATAMAKARDRVLLSSVVSAGSVAAAVLVAVLLGRVVIVGRLRVLADLVADVEQDRVCLLPRDFGTDEIGFLGRRFAGMSRELHEKNEKLAETMAYLRLEKERLETVVGQLGEAQVELLRRANFDALTGLRNRRFFNERLRKEFSRWRRYGTPFSLVLLDLDDFKRVNDTYGHWAGDEVLCCVAERTRQRLRDADDAYRVGGEEFALLLPQTRGEEALVVAERVRQAVAEAPIPLSDGGRVRLSASLGLAEGHPGMPAQKDLYTAADRALYQAKAQGKNRVVVWSPPAGAGEREAPAPSPGAGDTRGSLP